MRNYFTISVTVRSLINVVCILEIILNIRLFDQNQRHIMSYAFVLIQEATFAAVFFQ